MDPAVASVIAALISAAASILVTLIGKSPRGPTKRSAEPLSVYSVPARNKRAWIFVITILSIWLVSSPVLIHWDWGGMNFFLLPIVTLILSAVRPIKPSWAAAVVLILYPINFLMEPLGWWVADISGGYTSSGIAILLGLAFVNALGAWALARWRAKVFVEVLESAKQSGKGPTITTQSSSSLADELAKLNQLYKSGALSDDEFQTAKKRLLDE